MWCFRHISTKIGPILNLFYGVFIAVSGCVANISKEKVVWLERETQYNPVPLSPAVGRVVVVFPAYLDENRSDSETYFWYGVFIAVSGCVPKISKEKFFGSNGRHSTTLTLNPNPNLNP